MGGVSSMADARTCRYSMRTIAFLWPSPVRPNKQIVPLAVRAPPREQHLRVTMKRKLHYTDVSIDAYNW
jgi:hypothetical protein